MPLTAADYLAARKASATAQLAAWIADEPREAFYRNAPLTVRTGILGSTRMLREMGVFDASHVDCWMVAPAGDPPSVDESLSLETKPYQIVDVERLDPQAYGYKLRLKEVK
jgi:hypothetical protein